MTVPGLPVTPADLVEIEAIKRVKYAYARCLDTKQWDDLAELVTDDVEASYSAGAYAFNGRDALLEFLRSSMGSETFHSSHHMHHPEIDLTGPDTATGIWALEDVVIDTTWNITVRGASFYTDTYRKGTDGRWRIATTAYKRTYEELQPRGNVEGLRLTASLWATGGRSELAG